MMQPFMNPNYITQFPSYMNQQPAFANNNQNAINGMYVDSRSVVEATQGDLSGKPMYMPTTDGSTIYVKQLDNYGKSHVTTYVKQNDEEIQIKKSENEEILSHLEAIEEKIDKLRPANSRKKEVEE